MPSPTSKWSSTCPSPPPTKGGKRADGAAKGRGTQVNNGHLRSTTVTQKRWLNWANIPDQHFGRKNQGGSIPPSSTAPSKWPLTRFFVGVSQGRRIPPSSPQVCDQEKCVRSGRGNLGVATSHQQIGHRETAGQQGSSADRSRLGRQEGGRRHDYYNRSPGSRWIPRSIASTLRRLKGCSWWWVLVTAVGDWCVDNRVNHRDGASLSAARDVSQSGTCDTRTDPSSAHSGTPRGAERRFGERLSSPACTFDAGDRERPVLAFRGARSATVRNRPASPHCRDARGALRSARW